MAGVFCTKLNELVDKNRPCEWRKRRDADGEVSPRQSQQSARKRKAAPKAKKAAAKSGAARSKKTSSTKKTARKSAKRQSTRRTR